MQINEQASLKHLNTFGFDVKARYLISPHSIAEAQEALEWARQHNRNVIVLGEGSNVVLTKDVDGVVVHPVFSNCQLVSEDADFFYVEVAAGMNWHECVQYTLNQQYWGLENLSLIPGLVGAAPIQNIGAYGIELCDFFHELSALEITTGQSHIFTNADCDFSYRESIFKNKLKDQFLITSVTFKLLKKPQLKLEYAGIQTELDAMGVQASPLTVGQAICNIRNRKLPNPKQLGNAGSFFKNPVIDVEQYEQLKIKYPEIVAYDADNAKKIAAGWLIEKAGWKGKHLGSVAVHDKQALVLVNSDGKGSGEAIIELAAHIKQSVFNQFGITLEQEPRVY